MGRLSARAVHRVVTPPAGTDRLSIALFLGARLDSTVPLLALSPAGKPCGYFEVFGNSR